MQGRDILCRRWSSSGGGHDERQVLWYRRSREGAGPLSQTVDKEV